MSNLDEEILEDINYAHDRHLAMTIPDRKAEIRKRHADQAADIAGYLDWQQMAVMYRDVSDLLSMLDAVESERDQLKRRVAELEGAVSKAYLDAEKEAVKFANVGTLPSANYDGRRFAALHIAGAIRNLAKEALSTPAQVPATKEV